MNLTNKKIAVAITGSFCTFSNMFLVLERLKNAGADLYPVFSYHAATISCRFGKGEDFIKKTEALCGRPVINSISGAEPFGPKQIMDIMLIMPCTGNTLAKLSNGIVDTPVLMAAKAHLRNGRPLVISLSTNDGLGMNLKNIGLLLNTKNIYFVPLGQDDYVKKPNSLVAHLEDIEDTLDAALQHTQMQPLLKTYHPSKL